jgi:cell division protein FtsN
MPNYDHDRDDPRAFDGGEDADEAEGSHLPVVIIIAILVLAAFGGVVWLAYNQGVARGRGDTPVRVAAAETATPGNGQIKVYQQQAGAEEEENVPTAPMPQAAEPKPEPPAQATPPEAKPAPQPAATVTPPAALAVVKPQQKPAAPATTAPSAPPAQLGLARPPAATAAAPKPATTGSYLLQIGAYKSEAEALGAWKTYRVKHAALLTGFSPDVQRADLGDKGVWYRLRVAAFADKAAATALCDRLKAENGICIPAR